MQKQNMLMVIILVVAVGAAGFFGGTVYQKDKGGRFADMQPRNGMSRPTGVPGRGGILAGRPISGEIISLEDNNLTVRTQDGDSKIIVLAESTTVNKMTAGSRDDLRVAEQIMVIGREGSEGTVTAQTISVGGGMLGRVTAPPSLE